MVGRFSFDLEYYYSDIIKLAIKMGSIDENPKKNASKVCEKYWDLWLI